VVTGVVPASTVAVNVTLAPKVDVLGADSVVVVVTAATVTVEALEVEAASFAVAP
jgi:hypothetical protein